MPYMIDRMKLTRESYTQVMEEVVSDFGPDYVYEPTEDRVQWPSWQHTKCTYNPTGYQGRCLHGEVLHRMGYQVPLELENGPVGDVLSHFGVTDQVFQNAADRAQGLQDTGGSWGVALERFKDVLAGVGL